MKFKSSCCVPVQCCSSAHRISLLMIRLADHFHLQWCKSTCTWPTYCPIFHKACGNVTAGRLAPSALALLPFSGPFESCPSEPSRSIIQSKKLSAPDLSNKDLKTRHGTLHCAEGPTDSNRLTKFQQLSPREELKAQVLEDKSLHITIESSNRHVVVAKLFHCSCVALDRRRRRGRAVIRNECSKIISRFAGFVFSLDHKLTALCWIMDRADVMRYACRAGRVVCDKWMARWGGMKNNSLGWFKELLVLWWWAYWWSWAYAKCE